MNYWLIKSEPETYSWAMLVREGRTAWTGVRNFAARNHLRAMASGDRVLFYHSGEEKAVVGLAQVAKTAYADPTAEEGGWSAVDVAPVKPLGAPVTLQTIKGEKILRGMELVRQSRLSVSPVTREQFARLLELSGTKA